MKKHRRRTKPTEVLFRVDIASVANMKNKVKQAPAFTRQQIIDAVKRTTEENGSKPLSEKAFKRWRKIF